MRPACVDDGSFFGTPRIRLARDWIGPPAAPRRALVLTMLSVAFGWRRGRLVIEPSRAPSCSRWRSAEPGRPRTSSHCGRPSPLGSSSSSRRYPGSRSSSPLARCAWTTRPSPSPRSRCSSIAADRCTACSARAGRSLPSSACFADTWWSSPSRRRRSAAAAWRVYESSSWTAISLVGGVVAFVLLRPSRFAQRFGIAERVPLRLHGDSRRPLYWVQGPSESPGSAPGCCPGARSTPSLGSRTFTRAS